MSLTHSINACLYVTWVITQNAGELKRYILFKGDEPSVCYGNPV